MRWVLFLPCVPALVVTVCEADTAACTMCAGACFFKKREVEVDRYDQIELIEHCHAWMSLRLCAVLEGIVLHVPGGSGAARGGVV